MFNKLRKSEKSRINESHQQASYHRCYTQRAQHINQNKDNQLGSYSRMHKKKADIQSNNNQPIILQSQQFLFQSSNLSSKHQKNGEGIIYLSNGTMIIGTWHKDLLCGRALIFTSFGGMIAAHFLDGKLNGWAISRYKDNTTIATLYFQDKIDGQRLVYDAQQKIWIASKYNNQGKFVKISHVEKTSKDRLPSFVDSDELTDFFNDFVLEHNYLPSMKTIKQINILPSTLYIGYTNQNLLPEGLGVAFSEKEIYLGNYHCGFLNSFGRMIFNNGDIYQGYILDGAFNKQGIYYSPMKNSTILLSSLNPKTEIIEQYDGYTLLDFKPKLVHHNNTSQKHTYSNNKAYASINNFDGIVSKSLWELCQHIQKYYSQYFIQKNNKDANQYSLRSNADSQDSYYYEDDKNFVDGEHNNDNKIYVGRESRKQNKNFALSSVQNNDPVRITWSIPKIGWVEDQVEGQSDNMENYEHNDGHDLNSHNKSTYRDQSLPSPKKFKDNITFKSNGNNFESVGIKQNETPSQNETYGKNSPKAFRKQSMLHCQNRDEQYCKRMSDEYSRSLQVHNMSAVSKQLVVRKRRSMNKQNTMMKTQINNGSVGLNEAMNSSLGYKQTNNIYNASSSTSNILNSNEPAKADRQQQQNINNSSYYQNSNIDSSSISNISNKMAVIVKRSMTKRKKIFD